MNKLIILLICCCFVFSTISGCSDPNYQYNQNQMDDDDDDFDIDIDFKHKKKKHKSSYLSPKPYKSSTKSSFKSTKKK